MHQTPRLRLAFALSIGGAGATMGVVQLHSAMNPTRWILILFLACVTWVPVAFHLGRIAAQDQDAAGKGIYSVITTLFLLAVGGLCLGIPALLLARRHKQQVHLCAHVAAWLVLLSPVLVAGGVILFELIGDLFR